MTTFYINRKNILYKNYLIRINESFVDDLSFERKYTINFCHYSAFKDYFERYYFEGDSYGGSLVDGNFGDGWSASGILVNSYGKSTFNIQEEIKNYKLKADEFEKFKTSSLDSFWFFVVFCHLTFGIYHRGNNVLRLKTEIISQMLKMNNHENGILHLVQDGLKNNYFDTEKLKKIIEKEITLENILSYIKEEDSFLPIKKQLILLFKKEIEQIDSSFDDFEIKNQELKNEDVHITKILNKKFYIYRDKVICVESNQSQTKFYSLIFSPLDNMEPRKKIKNKNLLLQDLLSTKKEFLMVDNKLNAQQIVSNIKTTIDKLPQNNNPGYNLTGQLLAFYLKNLFSKIGYCGAILDIKDDDIYRELKIKEFLEHYVASQKEGLLNIFTEKFMKKIKEVSHV